MLGKSFGESPLTDFRSASRFAWSSIRGLLVFGVRLGNFAP